jgi:hypothetical protein
MRPERKRSSKYIHLIAVRLVCERRELILISEHISEFTEYTEWNERA